MGATEKALDFRLRLKDQEISHGRGAWILAAANGHHSLQQKKAAQLILQG
jgi:hypothetical protein